MFFSFDHINKEEIKEWIKSWNPISCIEGDYHNLKLPIETVSECGVEWRQIWIDTIDKILDKEDWYEAFLSNLNTIVMNMFIRIDNRSINIANYYECIIEVNDPETRKSMISGYASEDKDIGSIKIKDEEVTIGSIGNMSDLIFSVFRENFIAEYPSGGVEHNIYFDNLLSIKIWGTAFSSNEEFYNYIEELLFNCSYKLDLNFKFFDVSDYATNKEPVIHTELDYKNENLEEIPIKYYNNACQSRDIRLKFLSFYQVVEYYFIRAQNLNLVGELRKIGFQNLENDHTKLNEILKQHYNKSKERESLRLVLSTILIELEFNRWLNANNNVKEIMENSLKDRNLNIDFSKPFDKVLNKLALRIYFIRCSIAHAKGDSREFLSIPSLSDHIVVKELEIMKYLAQKAIITYKN